MKTFQQVAISSVITGSMFLPVGSALADTIDTSGVTGPNSTQEVVVNSTSQTDVSNTNTVVVTNNTVQQATTGSVVAQNNTVIGELASGDATNSNGTSTGAVIGSPVEETLHPTTDTPHNPAPVIPEPAPVLPAGQSNIGSVLGAAIVGGMGGVSQAVLPAVGATIPVDVSAIRAAWHDSTVTAAVLADHTRPAALFMFLIAAFLGAVGGLSNVVYLRRKEGRG